MQVQCIICPASMLLILFYYFIIHARQLRGQWFIEIQVCWCVAPVNEPSLCRDFALGLYYITAAWHFPGRLSFLFQTEMPPLLGFKHHYLFYPKHFNPACLFVILLVNWKGREGCMVEVGVFGILPNVICMYSEKIIMLSPRNVPLTIRPR